MSGASVVLRLDRHETFRASFVYQDSDGEPIDITDYTEVSIELVAGVTLTFDETSDQVTITENDGQIDLLVTTTQINDFTDTRGTIRIVLTDPLAEIEDVVEVVDGVFEVVD